MFGAIAESSLYVRIFVAAVDKRRHGAATDGYRSEDERYTKRQRLKAVDDDRASKGLRVSLKLDVTRDGASLGDMNLELKPLQVRFQRPWDMHACFLFS